MYPAASRFLILGAALTTFSLPVETADPVTYSDRNAFRNCANL